MNRCSFEFSQSNCEVPVGLSAVGGLTVGAIDLVNRPMNNFKSYLIFFLSFELICEYPTILRVLKLKPTLKGCNPQMVHNFLESV